MNRQLRARIVLEEARALGIDLTDLVAAATGEHHPITVTAWIDEIAPTFGGSTARTYRPYWRLLATMHGDRALTELTAMDLAAVVDAAGERAKAHRPDSTGRSSRESCVSALRALYRRAIDAGHVTTNPAAALRKPRRSTSRRRALDDRELTDLADAIRATRRDPNLDLLLVRFHLETGARVQGALNLRRRDIDAVRSTVWLHEKHDSVREQPAFPVAGRAAPRPRVRAWRERRRGRCGVPDPARHPDHRSLLRPALRPSPSPPGLDERTPLTAHVLRHTAVTRIGRIAGYPVAQAFAGHAPPTVTGRYLHATLADVATAVAALTGEAHPLAHEKPGGHWRCADRR